VKLKKLVIEPEGTKKKSFSISRVIVLFYEKLAWNVGFVK
jgi:hypothetical protein